MGTTEVLLAHSCHVPRKTLRGGRVRLEGLRLNLPPLEYYEERFWSASKLRPVQHGLPQASGGFLIKNIYIELLSLYREMVVITTP